MSSYIDSFKKGTCVTEGYPTSSYGMSKLGLIAMTKAMARKEQEVAQKNKITYVSCCPGWCWTDMGISAGGTPEVTADEGSENPVWLAMTSISNIADGEFYILKTEFYPLLFHRTF